MTSTYKAVLRSIKPAKMRTAAGRDCHALPVSRRDDQSSRIKPWRTRFAGGDTSRPPEAGEPDRCSIFECPRTFRRAGLEIAPVTTCAGAYEGRLHSFRTLFSINTLRKLQRRNEPRHIKPNQTKSRDRLSGRFTSAFHSPLITCHFILRVFAPRRFTPQFGNVLVIRHFVLPV